MSGTGLTVDTGNKSKRSVVDYQTIEMQDDHLYVYRNSKGDKTANLLY